MYIEHINFKSKHYVSNRTIKLYRPKIKYEIIWVTIDSYVATPS